MNLGARLLNLFAKESLARTALVSHQVGRPVSTPINYENLAKIGYGKSAIVYTCINKIAGPTRAFRWVIYDKSNPSKPKELDKHPLLDLWHKPNPMMTTADFFESMLSFLLVAGNSYVEANRGAMGALPLELWTPRPDKMRVVPNAQGYPAKYEFTANGIVREWPVDIVKMSSDILHWKTFNPKNDWYGMAPLEAAMLAVDQNIAGQEWNLALLQNSATPSGVLQVKISDANPRGEITDEQYRRMRADYEANYQGTRNTGKPMIIEGGLTWTQMSHSPRDVDYSKGRELSATDICLVFGVPPELVGMGQKTFNNFREARLALFEETIMPLADAAIQGINRWLAPAFQGENSEQQLCLDYDKDSIDILVWKREQKFTSLATVNFLTQNEKREAIGYEPDADWEDVYVIGNQVGAKPEDFAGGGSAGLDPETEDGPVDDTDEDVEDPNGDEEGKPEEETEDDNDLSPKPDSSEDSDAKGWKSVNLVTANEKRQSWIRQNKRRARLQAGFNRDLNSDFKDLVSQLKKVKGNKDDARLTEYALLKVLSDFMPDMQKTLKRHIRYTLEDFGGMILGEGKTLGYDREHKANLKFDHYVKSYTETRSGSAIKSISQTSTKNIKRIVGEWTQTAITDGDSLPELSKFIEAEFEELTPAMATRIARTEVSLASNNGALEAVKSLQIPNMFKEWVTANDDRVRSGEDNGADHGVMNGAEVGLDEKFGVPPDALMEGPGDNSAGADQVINCRCVLTYRSKN